jgi:hypothetical protein
VGRAGRPAGGARLATVPPAGEGTAEAAPPNRAWRILFHIREGCQLLPPRLRMHSIGKGGRLVQSCAFAVSNLVTDMEEGGLSMARSDWALVQRRKLPTMVRHLLLTNSSKEEKSMELMALLHTDKPYCTHKGFSSNPSKPIDQFQLIDCICVLITLSIYLEYFLDTINCKTLPAQPACTCKKASSFFNM